MNSPAFQNDNLQESLGGYVEYSLTEFPIRVLIEDDRNPFPLASAIALKLYDENDEITKYFYQPYHTNVSCFVDTFNDTRLQLSEENFPNNTQGSNRTRSRVPYFSEDLWKNFRSEYRIDPGESDHERYLQCVNQDFTCR